MMKAKLAFAVVFVFFSLTPMGLLAQDNKETVKQTTKAAEQGDATAQCMLGVMYDNGEGVPQNNKEAIKWFTKAAEQGDAIAQCMLGVMYYNGEGVLQDYKEAVKWYTKAAEQGFADSQCNLALMYLSGQGVPQDYKAAIKWFTKAAEQGSAKAQKNLGWMYENGNGVPQDYIQAYKWYNLAAAQGGQPEKESRNNIIEKMSVAQIAEAQRLSQQFSARTGEHTASAIRKPAATAIRRNGTGFFITPDGYVLTAYHVVKEAELPHVWTNEKLTPARVVRVDVANDIALLKVDGVKAVALPVRSSRDVKIGLDIFTLGFPNNQLQGTEVKYTQGNISSLSGAGDDRRLFQVSVPVQRGNSGGPLLDEHGQVIGMVIAKLDDIYAAQTTVSMPQNVNYALKSSFVLSFLESLTELRGRLVQNENKGLTRTQVVKQSSDAVVMVLCY